jgi:2-amino-4-hydroxy-6-hydroxymethyldihydropteridine diphosphokinase
VDNHPGLAYVGVGSNIRPEKNVIHALRALSDAEGVTLTGISTFLRTAPLPGPEVWAAPLQWDIESQQPDFLNGVLEIRTVLTPHDLLALLADIERTLGRVRRGDRYASRTMDLDLLLYRLEDRDGTNPVWQVIGPGDLLIHSDIQTRPFVAHPLLELAPDLMLPPHGTPLRAITVNFDTPGGRPETDFTDGLRRRFLPA